MIFAMFVYWSCKNKSFHAMPQIIRIQESNGYLTSNLPNKCIIFDCVGQYTFFMELYKIITHDLQCVPVVYTMEWPTFHLNFLAYIDIKLRGDSKQINLLHAHFWLAGFKRIHLKWGDYYGSKAIGHELNDVAKIHVKFKREYVYRLARFKLVLIMVFFGNMAAILNSVVSNSYYMYYPPWASHKRSIADA